jgi:DNA mismatch endonuclease (patch repair protein)
MQTNRIRDAETNRLLLEAGWQVIRIWEHEPVSQAVEKVTFALSTVMGPASGPQRTPRPGA